MKLCPYCGKSIVRHALVCKHCGEWLEDISDYLVKRGSIYAHTDSMVINNSSKANQPAEKKSNCVFCESEKVLSQKEILEKRYICSSCGKKNLITGKYVEDILRNIPIGWGWLILTAYFIFSIQRYIGTLDDEVQMGITFGLSLSVLLALYFSTRWYLLKIRFVKKRNLQKIYNASIASGFLSIIGSAFFIFAFHFAYPLTGLQTDKKFSDEKIFYFKAKISELAEKQKGLNEIISKPHFNKKESVKNSGLLDEYITLNNDEKKYTDSIFRTLEESEYYSEKISDKKKIKDANLVGNKIIVYRIMSARNLKHYYLTGDNNALKAVEELNSEIYKLTRDYSVKFEDLFNTD
ncbi:MAG: hypothetical protein HY959_11820 [Ignavibacteriae bacterium]|nr:hypothetical protein [Ignavibacteriota bacterium]